MLIDSTVQPGGNRGVSFEPCWPIRRLSLSLPITTIASGRPPDWITPLSWSASAAGSVRRGANFEPGPPAPPAETAPRVREPPAAGEAGVGAAGRGSLNGSILPCCTAWVTCWGVGRGWRPRPAVGAGLSSPGLSGGGGGATEVGEPPDPGQPQEVVNQGRLQRRTAPRIGTRQGRSAQVVLRLALFHQIAETVKVGLQFSYNNATHNGRFH